MACGRNGAGAGAGVKGVKEVKGGRAKANRVGPAAKKGEKTILDEVLD
jgi:hypothetical protein